MHPTPATLEANNALHFAFSEINDRRDNQPRHAARPWGEFCARFAEPERARGELDSESYHGLDPANAEEKRKRDEEKDGPAWIAATFKQDGARTSADVTGVSAFVGDCDNGLVTMEMIKTTLAGIEFFAHTSYSHRPEKPKLRLIVPFSSPISPASLDRVFEHFNALFENGLDRVGRKPAQLYYTPSCPFDATFEYFRGLGEVFDPSRMPPGTPQTARCSVIPKPAGTLAGELPAPCRDSERHTTFLPAAGAWIARGFPFEQVMQRAHAWNTANIDPWPDAKLVAIVKSLFRTDARKHPERHRKAPWDGLVLPPGYRLAPEGVFFASEDGKKPECRLSGPIWASASTRDTHGRAWGRQLEWLDGEGHHHKAAFPAARFHEMGQRLAQDLASDGLNIVPGQEKRLLTYLGLFHAPRHLRSVASLGWLDSDQGRLLYVLPERSIGGAQREDHIFQPERHSPTAATMTTTGTLEQWQDQVARPVAGNACLTFFLSAAFAGPLLKAANAENGGFHLYGRSSFGKTTAMQIAASVWGSGADPAADPAKSYVQRWNTTSNGLEGLAAAHNDGLLILDEIGTCNAQNFGRVIYEVSGGRGKTAMTADRNLKPVRNWRLLILSTGEISARQKIEEEKATAHAGQLLRLMEIPIAKGVVQQPHGLEPAEYVNRLKQACARYYGSAGPAFLDRLIARFTDFRTLAQYVGTQLKQCEKALTPAKIQPEQQRALRRVALVQVAGLLAVELGILPLDPEEIIKAVHLIRDAWLRDLETLPDAERGVEAIRDFILKHAARLRLLAAEAGTPLPRDLAGYVDSSRKLYLLTPEGFREATHGFDCQAVCRELRRMGLLHLNENDRSTSKHRVPGIADRIRLFAIHFAILEDQGPD